MTSQIPSVFPERQSVSFDHKMTDASQEDACSTQYQTMEGTAPPIRGVGIHCRTAAGEIFMGPTFFDHRRTATEHVIVIKRHAFLRATFHRERVQFTSLRRGLKPSAAPQIYYPVKQKRNLRCVSIHGTSSKNTAKLRTARGNYVIRKAKSIMTWKEIKHTTFLLPETRHDLILKPSTTRTLDHRINGPMITQM